MQARWGSHGDYSLIAYAPWSPQEAFDLTVLCFNMADRFRTPVLLLGDEVIGHMVERVVIPAAAEIPHWERKRPGTPPPVTGVYRSFEPDPEDLIPPLPHAGEGYRVHFTGLTHDERGYPDMSADTHHALVTRLNAKIQRHAEEIIRLEEYAMDGARLVVVSFGCTARSARRAVREARAQGIPVGLLRLVSLWPFPEAVVRELGQRMDAFIVAEMNLGQVRLEVERCIGRPAWGIHHAGGEMIHPEKILAAIVAAAKNA
jgi:2-oxoglutarate ferredoxin oxidoreductase subunit alpha